jgi:hypothetical protein
MRRLALAVLLSLLPTALLGDAWQEPGRYGQTFPPASLTRSDQVVSGGAIVPALSLPTGSFTIDCGLRPLQYITNGGAFTITAPLNDGSCILLVTNNASAGTITFTGFTDGSNTGDSLTTTNTNIFYISIFRINGKSAHMVHAGQ